MRLRWEPIIIEAARIAASYATPVTLRQLHYRLVAANVGGYVNTTSCYKQLSAHTARGRRDGTFPPLVDMTRGFQQPPCWDSIADALGALADQYRLDHTEGQEHQIWLLLEKATLVAQVGSWTSPYGLRFAALRGYSSEPLERSVFDAMDDDGRPAVGFYIGDIDPEGEDVERNFRAQADDAGCYFKCWERLAIRPEQIDELGLVPNPGKEKSSRAPGFVAKYGELFQIEVEAIDPEVLRRLVVDAVTDERWFDADIYDEVLDREADDRDRLAEIARDQSP